MLSGQLRPKVLASRLSKNCFLEKTITGTCRPKHELSLVKNPQEETSQQQRGTWGTAATSARSPGRAATKQNPLLTRDHQKQFQVGTLAKLSSVLVQLNILTKNHAKSKEAWDWGRNDHHPWGPRPRVHFANPLLEHPRKEPSLKQRSANDT